MFKLSSSKKRSFFAIIFLIIFLLLLIIFLFKFFLGSVTIRTQSSDYCYFEGFTGYSNLEVFPANPQEISEVKEYYYCCVDSLMDPKCKIFMECFFDDSKMFEEECSRLSQITAKNEYDINEIQYSETLFKYPAYIAMYDWSSCYEYALILEEQKTIVYVFLQGHLQKMHDDYMPLNLNNDNRNFSIYSFNGLFYPKYR